MTHTVRIEIGESCRLRNDMVASELEMAYASRCVGASLSLYGSGHD